MKLDKPFGPAIASEITMNWGEGTKKIRAVVSKDANGEPVVVLEEGFPDAMGQTAWVKLCATDGKEIKKIYDWLLYGSALYRTPHWRGKDELSIL